MAMPWQRAETIPTSTGDSTDTQGAGEGAFHPLKNSDTHRPARDYCYLYLTQRKPNTKVE